MWDTNVGIALGPGQNCFIVSWGGGNSDNVKVRQCLGQTMSELKFAMGGGGVTQTMSESDNVQVVKFAVGGNSESHQDGCTDADKRVKQYQHS